MPAGIGQTMEAKRAGGHKEVNLLPIEKKRLDNQDLDTMCHIGGEGWCSDIVPNIYGIKG